MIGPREGEDPRPETDIMSDVSKNFSFTEIHFDPISFQTVKEKMTTTKDRGDGGQGQGQGKELTLPSTRGAQGIVKGHHRQS